MPMKNMKNNVNNSLQSNMLFGRKKEAMEIEKFLRSNSEILHITGNPGTGKTFTVKNVLRSSIYKYLNYFHEPKINLAIKMIKDVNLVVLDEFDSYYRDNRKECLKNIILLKSKGIKIITISNDLRMGDIKFLPYSANEIVDIVKCKLEENSIFKIQNVKVKEQILDNATLKFMALKYSKNGDLRGVLKKVLELCATKYIKDGKNFNINIRDLIDKQEGDQSKGVHQELIYKIKTEGNNESGTYKKYNQECKHLSIAPLGRSDFKVIFDIYD